jgi:GH18 family chitinase
LLQTKINVFIPISTHSLELANVEKWRSMNLRIFMHIGSWDNEKRLSGTQFSKLLALPKARERLATALANRLQLNNFDGLLVSWYYPGCNRV